MNLFSFLFCCFYACAAYGNYGFPYGPFGPCHYNGRPADNRLHCDPSPYQLLFIPGSRNVSYAKQKKNLIVIDIDQTVLDAKSGFDGPIHWQHDGPIH